MRARVRCQGGAVGARPSEWTVQDHVKALLAKFDVQSRGELVAALLFGHYATVHGSS